MSASPILGVDVGGTKVETALVDASGTVLTSHRHPINADQGARRVIDDITGRDVHAACEHGDPMATRLVDATAEHLGIGLVGVVNAFNPHRIVLGGGGLRAIRRTWSGPSAS